MRLRIAEVARRNKKWSMRKLADKLDCEHQTVMYWNQGRTYPRLPTLWKMCKLLECTLEDLVEDYTIPAGAGELLMKIGKLLEERA